MRVGYGDVQLDQVNYCIYLLNKKWALHWLQAPIICLFVEELINPSLSDYSLFYNHYFKGLPPGSV